MVTSISVALAKVVSSRQQVLELPLQAPARIPPTGESHTHCRLYAHAALVTYQKVLSNQSYIFRNRPAIVMPVGLWQIGRRLEGR